MKFHSTHGTAVTLSESQTLATRAETHFCNGIVFADQPLKIGLKVCLELECSSSWSGALRIGVTSNDPGRLTQKDLPKYAVPHFSEREGYWVRAVSEGFTSTGTKLTVYINSAGQLQCFVNNNHKGAYLTNLPTDRTLWLFLDIYGNTKAVRFVKPDEAPKEILARGPDAIQAYEEACNTGMQPVHRTRLMLVGQDRVGKTTLKRSLMGQSYNAVEETTNGIDLSASCSFNMGDRSKWRTSIRGKSEDDVRKEDRKNLGVIGGSEGLEEEYHRAIATNIVQELLFQRRQKEAQAAKSRASTGSKETIKLSSTSKKEKERSNSLPNPAPAPPPKLSDVPRDLLEEVPERVVQLVQEMLEQRASDKKTPEAKSKSFGHSNVVLNIWDFAGHAVYNTTHQVFLSSRAVYVIVFNLCHDLLAHVPIPVQEEPREEVLSTFGHMDFWMRSIHAHASHNTRSSVDNTTLSPPIFIVGTHRNSLHSDPQVVEQMVEEKFGQMRSFLVGKPYTQHVVTPFFAVENSLDEGQDEQILALRKHIEEVSSQESYMGEQMPIKWLKFEHGIGELVDSGANYATFDQMRELAFNYGIIDDQEVKTMLEFYHDLGVLIYYGGSGTTDNVLRNTVILKPQWLIDTFKQITTSKEQSDQWPPLTEHWNQLEALGILEEPLIDYLWCHVLDQKPVLLGLMEKFDLICQRIQTSQSPARYPMGASYYVPSRLARYTDRKRLYAVGNSDITFYLDFKGFLPDGLFHRILTRAVCWSQEIGGRNPYCMFSTVARFYLDTEHDFVLEMAPRRFNRIKVVVLRIAEPQTDADDDGESEQTLTPPSPFVCAKVRNFLESTLTDLREMWMRRIWYKTCVECPCGRPCWQHNKSGCNDDTCLHFLDLDECQSNRIVLCEHRRIKTTAIKKYFPEILTPGFEGQVLPPFSLDDTRGNIEKHSPDLPSWVKSAAKLLNSGSEKQDWLALAKQLGYSQAHIDKFNDDFNPGLALIADWIMSSGNTGLSVDLLTIYLEKIDREDIVEVIHDAKASDQEPPQIFISYQWDMQDDVKAMRDKLERSGFSCWMDIGQMGGGDQLNARIDEGIRNCKAVIACVSPKYVVSHLCNRELSLADLLRKPIIPVMYEKVMWPPPGGMALVFTQLIYINMKGVGGHGGTGVHADLEDKYLEIIQRVSRYAIPDLTRCIEVAKTIEETGSKQASHNREQTHSYSSMEDSFTHAEMANFPDQVSVESSLPGDRPLLTSDDMIPRPFGVQRVQMTKCGICCIL